MSEWVVFECYLNDGLRTLVESDDYEQLAEFAELTCEHPTHIVWWD